MSAPHERPRALLFDLGRVLVGYDWHEALRRLAARVDPTGERVAAQEVATWMLGPEGPHDAYCLGQIDSAGLFAAIHERYDPQHRLDDAWLTHLWCDMFTAMPDALATVDAVKGQAKLALVSNTNALHFDHLEREFGLRRRFDHVSVSHEVGSMKPAPTLYLDALAAVGCSPEQAWFVDDLAVNVEAARALGMRASRFENVALLRSDLRALGFSIDVEG